MSATRDPRMVPKVSRPLCFNALAAKRARIALDNCEFFINRIIISIHFLLFSRRDEG